MADLGDIQWPTRLVTERLLLRATEASDRAGYLELLTSQKVRRHLGGARERDEVEAKLPETPGAHPGVFAVEHDGQFLGTVILHRRDPDRPGHARPAGLKLEVSYTLLPRWWGMGYATEAVHAALAWAREATSETNVLLCTQVANERAMAVARRLGFIELDRFTEFNARQWLGIRDL